MGSEKSLLADFTKCLRVVEVDQTGNPFVEELLVEPLVVRDGQLSLSRAPGLGIELNKAALQRYRVQDPLRIADGSYSDMTFGKSVQLSKSTSSG